MNPSDDDERAAGAGAEPEDTQLSQDDVARREAAAWQAIVDNYGDHPSFDEPGPVEEPRPREVARSVPSRLDLDDEPPETVASDTEEHFVPPPPPRVHLAAPPRLLAWVGLFGVPVLTLVALVVGVTLPQWLSVLLMAWFVGGFVFLVASMRPGPRDGHDDGAVL